MTATGWGACFSGFTNFPGMFLADGMMTGVGRDKWRIARDPDLGGLHVIRQATSEFMGCTRECRLQEISVAGINSVEQGKQGT